MDGALLTFIGGIIALTAGVSLAQATWPLALKLLQALFMLTCLTGGVFAVLIGWAELRDSSKK